MFGISLVNQNHMRTFTIMNTGTLALDFECVWMTLKPSVIKAQGLEFNMRKHIDAEEPMADLQRNRVILKNFDFDDLQPCEPELLHIKPMKGNFGIAEIVEFTIIYTPKRERRSAVLCESFLMYC